MSHKILLLLCIAIPAALCTVFYFRYRRPDPAETHAARVPDAPEPKPVDNQKSSSTAQSVTAALSFIRENSEQLETNIRAGSHPDDLLDDTLFREAVAQLSRPEVSVEVLYRMATGAQWVHALVAIETIFCRDDAAEAVDQLIPEFSSGTVWTNHFICRAIRKHSDMVLSPALLTHTQYWWEDNTMMTALAEEQLKIDGQPEKKIDFKNLLSRKSADELENIDDFVKTLDPVLTSNIAHALKSHITRKTDEESLRKNAQSYVAESFLAWTPESDRFDQHAEQVTRRIETGDVKSVILSGEPGVGRRDVARRILDIYARNEWRIYTTSAIELIADKKYIGEIEGVLTRIIDAADTRKKVVIFIDRFHELMTAGVTRQSPQSVLELLFPAMEKNRVCIVSISTTTAMTAVQQRFPRLASVAELVQLDAATEAESLDFGEQLLRESNINTTRTQTLADAAAELADRYLAHIARPRNTLDLLRVAINHAEAPDTPPLTDRSQIIDALSRLSGLPTDVIDTRSTMSVAELTASFEKHVVGQHEAVEAVVQRITMLKAGLQDPTRPIGVFMFAGPTGTGKTEIAKTLARVLFGTEDRLVRFDMSEYQAPDSAERLLAAQGADTGTGAGSLISRVRQQPFAVILLDEFEKAHSNVWDIFLQVFDDGRLTDRGGNTANLRNTIIILTSNAGSRIERNAPPGFSDDTPKFSRKDVEKSIDQMFRKEFINRLDHVVVFNPLTRDVMRGILDKELAVAMNRSGLRERQWAIEWEDSAKEFLLDQGFTPDLGARPLKRAVEQHFLAPLAATMVENRAPDGDQFLFVRARNGKLDVQFVDPDAELESPTVTDAEVTGDLRRHILSPACSESSITHIISRADGIAQRTESAAWKNAKQKHLQSMTASGFWEDESRFTVLETIEQIDRLEQGVETLERMINRLKQNPTSERLLRDAAERVFLLEKEFSDRDQYAPASALLTVMRGSQLASQAEETAFSLVTQMYRQWAQQRGARLNVLEETADTWRVEVTGFGAYGLLAPETGLHLFSFQSDETERASVTVGLDNAPSPAEAGEVVRRYRIGDAPLVRSGDGTWRSGRVDLVLAGNFDVLGLR